MHFRNVSARSRGVHDIRIKSPGGIVEACLPQGYQIRGNSICQKLAGKADK